MAYETKGKSDKQLVEERAAIVMEARKYHDEHENDWTDDREAQFSSRMEDASDIKAVLDRRAVLRDAEGQQLGNLDAPERPKFNADLGGQSQKILARNGLFDSSGQPRYIELDPGERSGKYHRDFCHFLQTGKGRPGLWAHAGSQNGTSQYAALQSDDADQAGYLVASEELASGILRDVDDLLFVRRFATIRTVREASSLGIRKRTARMSTFGWSHELTVSTADSTLAYGKKILTPHHLTGQILISRDLARRSAVGIDAEVRREMARDSGEVMEDAFFTGHGSQQPLGVFTASSDGISTSRDVSSGSSTSITADALRDAKYSLKSQYRNMGPRWLFHRDGVKIISKLKDGNGQYLWQPGVSMGDPDMLLSYPVDESERAPSTFTTAQYVGLLAVWRFYEIADALDMEVQVLMELNAATNQIGYIGRLKTDGMPTLEEAFARLQTD